VSGDLTVTDDLILNNNYGGIRWEVVEAPDNTWSASVSSCGTSCSSLGTGNYTYQVSFITANGETNVIMGNREQVTTTAGSDQQVTITLPTCNDSRIIGRKIYRTVVNETAEWRKALYLATVNDCTTTTYVDTASDASLSSPYQPYVNTTSKWLVDGDGNRMFYWGTQGLHSNFFIGWNAGNTTITGYANQMWGSKAGMNITNGDSNIGIGDQAMLNLTTSADSTAVGALACHNLTTGIDNVCIGSTTNAGTTGSGNTSVGAYSGASLSTGGSNTAIGHYALNAQDTESYETAIGKGALQTITSGGGRNTAVGSFSGKNLVDGTGNIFLGYQAGSALTQAGSGTLSNNIIIGTYACSASGTLCNPTTMSDILWIDGSNNDPPLIYGEFDTRRMVVYGLLSTGNETTTLAAGADKLNPSYGSITVTADSGGNTIYGIKSTAPAAGTKLTIIFNSSGGTLTIPDDPNCDDAGGPKTQYYVSVQLTADWIPNSTNDTLTLMSNGTCWIEVSRSDN
jgi:hypothetical protein